MNSRPQPYQGCALPLSYGSIPGAQGAAGARLRDEGGGIVKAKPARDKQRMADKDEKAARLGAALRENLRKRKAQARGSAAPQAEPRDDEPSR